MAPPSADFDENEPQRSDCIRAITLAQLATSDLGRRPPAAPRTTIPRKIVRFWHDSNDVPDDVNECLRSWDRLQDHGFEFYMFDDYTAADYIQNRYGAQETAAFSRCRHPAMRSDYLRLCFILAEGGFYVDADDVLLSDGWEALFVDDRLKIQPLCYDIADQGMLPAAEIWQPDLAVENRIFYVNNDPLVAPAGHPIVRKALSRASARLLSGELRPEIQDTTGPGNLTAVLAAHARKLTEASLPLDFELIRDWDGIAETRWPLSYRNDARNWRNMDA